MQEALGRLSLEAGVPRLGNVLPTREEQPLMGLLVQCRGQVISKYDFGCLAWSHLSSLKSSCQGQGGLWRVQVSGSEAAQLGLAAAPGKADENWCLSELDRFNNFCFGSSGKGEECLSAPDCGKAATALPTQGTSLLLEAEWIRVCTNS